MSQEVLDIIKKVPVFRDCTSGELEDILASSAEVRNFGSHEYLYKEGDQPNNVYVLLEGTIKVFMRNGQGRQMVSEIVNQHDLIGIDAIIADTKHTQSAQVMDPSTLLLLSAVDIKFITQFNGHFSLALSRYCVRKLQTSYAQQMQLLFKPARQRVANSLLYLHQVLSDQGVHETILTNRTEIARLSGSTRESATKLIKEFERDHIVKVSGNRIQINNLDKLKKLSRQYS